LANTIWFIKKNVKYTIRASLFISLLTLAAIALCLKAGFWQYNKAQAKLALQSQLTARMAEAPVELPSHVSDLENWRYKQVKFTGVYDTKYQVYIDNQVEDTKVGYHILTPMLVTNSRFYVLVNRGWIAGSPNRNVPVVTTPAGKLEIEGEIGLPSQRFFTLEAPQTNDKKWQPVWQNLDMARYAKSVPFAVQPFIVRLHPNSQAGGFIRNWPAPGDRVGMHLGYAYQWFGFALTLLIIYIVLNVKKVE
jgi:surfeit locus 1 family protein